MESSGRALFSPTTQGAGRVPCQGEKALTDVKFCAIRLRHIESPSQKIMQRSACGGQIFLTPVMYGTFDVWQEAKGLIARRGLTALVILEAEQCESQKARDKGKQKLRMPFLFRTLTIHICLIRQSGSRKHVYPHNLNTKQNA